MLQKPNTPEKRRKTIWYYPYDKHFKILEIAPNKNMMR